MLAKTLFYLSVSAAVAFAEDWPSLFNSLVSTDNAVSTAARERVFALLPTLAAKSDQELNAEIVRLLPVAEDTRDAVRSQVSGLLVGLALNRGDGLASLKAAIPILIRWTRDPDEGVRLNAHLILANLKPLPPVEALDALAVSLKSTEIRAAGSAAVALGRLAATTPKAVQLLSASLEGEKVRERLVAVIYGIGEARTTDSALVQKVAVALEHSDSRVVFSALDCLGKLGGAAAIAEPSVRKLAAQRGAPGSLKTEISDAAQVTLTRIGKR